MMDQFAPRRLATWWVTWQDLDWPSEDGLDRIRRRADSYAEAGVTTGAIFGTHFRWDWLPCFTLLHDYLAAVTEAFHERGMELVDHHSVNLVHRYHTREEMRYCMQHSGPHLPFCPSYEAAESWKYNGMYLNDWRMIDTWTREPLYYPQYQSEGFCYRNPEFIESYIKYAKQLVADTGIDGLMADDTVQYMHYRGCACKYCRAELRRRSGIDLPPIEDTSFWGNFDNPAWRDWIDLRYDACGEFQSKLRDALPEKFLLMSCGSRSARSTCNGHATDARQFLRGCNYTNIEFSGNTPPYKGDPVTVNYPISDSIINASHHLAAGREKGVRCFGTTFGFSTAAAEICWAVNKMTGADCWFGTLKPRLGLPKHILDTLPDEGELIGRPFLFEQNHPELFTGDTVPQLAVYFSYETRNHTRFGNMAKGYYADYAATAELLFRSGISAHTVFAFPQDASVYPLVLLPSPLRMTDAERSAMNAYLAAGGRVIVTGPADIPGCEHNWSIPNRVDASPEDFYERIENGVRIMPAPWMNEAISASGDEAVWTQVRPGLYYNPVRTSDGRIREELLSLCRRFMAPLPLTVTGAEGYLISVFRDGGSYTVHLLAADYDTDIDHHLDEIRSHRSRVNFINKVEPVGISRTFTVQTDRKAEIYTPFCEKPAVIRPCPGGLTVTLPEKCAYAILSFQEETI